MGTEKTKSRKKPDKGLLILNAAVVLWMVAVWLLYFGFGDRLIEAAYHSPWVELLHKAMMMEGRNILPLEQYFRGADKLMRSATFAGVLLVSASTLIAKCPPRITVPTLGSIFVLFAVSASAIAFFYPLEIETRESTVWLHVLAMRDGLNIYNHNQVAFINQNHGPFDPIFKLAITALLPFLEPWHVTRFAVLALPFGFLLGAWKLLRNSRPGSAMDIAYLGAIGYVFLVVSAKEFLFVGRSDATAALLLLPLAYLSFTSAPRNSSAFVLRGILWGALGISVALTNWRMLPVVFALFVFSVWILRDRHRMTLRALAGYAAGCAGAAAAIFAFFLYQFFDFDLSLYYKHFFGVYSHSSGHGHGTYGHASALWFLGSLFNPTASPDNLKGGPLLLALMVYLLVPGKGSLQNKAWLFLGSFIFVACTLAYYLNYYGGGQWYYIPFLIVLWFFLCANYPAMSRSRLSAVGISTAALLLLNYNTVVTPSLQRLSTRTAAHDFLNSVRALQLQNTVLSEDTFFYRISYGGERIDMGDMVSKIRARGGGYYGEAFNKTVDTHFEQLRRDPPDYIVTGFTESPELRQLIAASYVQIGAGPDNLTANGVAASQLFQRKDLGPSLAAGRYSDEPSSSAPLYK